MKTWRYLLITILCSIATNTYAHVRWDVEGSIPPRDFGSRTSCPERTNAPTLLRAGSSLTVAYEVLILHGEPIRIDFSPANDLGFSNHILGTLSETTGKTTTTIQLPDILCDACTLRVHGGGYMSCADIQLTETGLPEPDPSDTTPPNEVSNLASLEASNQTSLTWSNPTEDFFKTLVIQSDSEIADAPTNGTNYELGDMFGSAEVVYTGMASTTAVTNLSPNSTYYFKVFTYDQSLNYSNGVTVVATTPASENTTPLITLNVMQNTTIGTTINANDGVVMVQAVVEDPDTEDTHQFDWSDTDSRLVDLDSEGSKFSFDPEQLEAGDYTLQVRVLDDGQAASEVLQTTTIRVNTEQVQPMVNEATPNISKSRGGGSLSFAVVLCLYFSLFLRIKITRKE